MSSVNRCAFVVTGVLLGAITTFLYMEMSFQQQQQQQQQQISNTETHKGNVVIEPISTTKIEPSPSSKHHAQQQSMQALEARMVSLDEKVDRIVGGHFRLPSTDRFLYLGDHTALCHTHNSGVTRKLFVSTTDQGMMPHVCAGNVWESENEQYFYDALQQVPKGSTIVEMGTNIGYFTQLFGHLGKARSGGGGHNVHVVGVEANPTIHRFCNMGLEISGLKGISTIHNAVLSNTSGGGEKRIFCTFPERPLNGRLSMTASGCGRGGVPVPLPTITAGSLFPKDLTTYVFVKIDVDWAEGLVWESLQALMHERRQLLPHVTVELNPGRNFHWTMKQILVSMKDLYGTVGQLIGTRCVAVAIDDTRWFEPDDKVACLRSNGAFPSSGGVGDIAAARRSAAAMRKASLFSRR